MKAKVIPAAPGFEVLKSVPGDLGELLILKHPVIAWRVYPDGECGVIALTEKGDSADECTILCPDGKVLEDGDRRATYAEWEAEQKRKWRERPAKYYEPTAEEIAQGYADAHAAMAEIEAARDG